MPITTVFKNISVLYLLFISMGCAVFTVETPEDQAITRVFQIGYEDTWNAILASLTGIPLDAVNKDEGFIRTEWLEKRSDRREMGVFFAVDWRERRRLLISVVSISAINPQTRVSITAQVEEKAPGGAQAFRWQRKGSDGVFEKDIFDKIEGTLVRKEKDER